MRPGDRQIARIDDNRQCLSLADQLCKACLAPSRIESDVMFDQNFNSLLEQVPGSHGSVSVPLRDSRSSTRSSPAPTSQAPATTSYCVPLPVTRPCVVPTRSWKRADISRMSLGIRCWWSVMPPRRSLKAEEGPVISRVDLISIEIIWRANRH